MFPMVHLFILAWGTQFLCWAWKLRKSVFLPPWKWFLMIAINRNALATVRAPFPKQTLETMRQHTMTPTQTLSGIGSLKQEFGKLEIRKIKEIQNIRNIIWDFVEAKLNECIFGVIHSRYDPIPANSVVFCFSKGGLIMRLRPLWPAGPYIKLEPLCHNYTPLTDLYVSCSQNLLTFEFFFWSSVTHGQTYL